QDGYADTFQQLLDSTDWSKYGYEYGNGKCSNCMLHSGYEATAVDYTFSFRGIFATVRSMLFPRYPDAEELAQLAGENPKPLLVQIESVNRASLQGVTLGADENL